MDVTKARDYCIQSFFVYMYICWCMYLDVFDEVSPCVYIHICINMYIYVCLIFRSSNAKIFHVAMQIVYKHSCTLQVKISEEKSEAVQKHIKHTYILYTYMLDQYLPTLTSQRVIHSMCGMIVFEQFLPSLLLLEAFVYFFFREARIYAYVCMYEHLVYQHSR